MLVPDESNRFRVRVAIALMPAIVVAFVLCARATRSPTSSDQEVPESAESPVPAALPAVRLIVPTGVFHNPPGLFLWEAVPAAASYRLTVSDQDMIWPLARRTGVETQAFFPSSERRAWSAPRRYSWLVEAFGDDPGNLIARGEGTFAIGEPQPDPDGLRLQLN